MAFCVWKFRIISGRYTYVCTNTNYLCFSPPSPGFAADKTPPRSCAPVLAASLLSCFARNKHLLVSSSISCDAHRRILPRPNSCPSSVPQSRRFCSLTYVCDHTTSPLPALSNQQLPWPADPTISVSSRILIGPLNCPHHDTIYAELTCST